MQKGQPMDKMTRLKKAQQFTKYKMALEEAQNAMSKEERVEAGILLKIVKDTIKVLRNQAQDIPSKLIEEIDSTSKRLEPLISFK